MKLIRVAKKRPLLTKNYIKMLSLDRKMNLMVKNYKILKLVVYGQIKESLIKLYKKLFSISLVIILMKRWKIIFMSVFLRV